MKLINKDTGLSLVIDDNLIDKLILLSNHHRPNEFGGFLVGYYSEDLKILSITDTILPIKYNSTRYLFVRETKGIKNQLQNFYREKISKYYVGEWHSHPDNLPIPSTTDLLAIKSIVNHPNVAINNPVFLIIGYTKNQPIFEFYIPFKNRLYKYEQQN